MKKRLPNVHQKTVVFLLYEAERAGKAFSCPFTYYLTAENTGRKFIQG